MKSLIIAKPACLAAKKLGALLQRIEQAGLVIVGIKAMNLDMHNFAIKAHKEKDAEKQAKLVQARAVPCVLIVVQATNAISEGVLIETEFNGLVHASANEEVSKYEIARFFTEQEILVYDATGTMPVFGLSDKFLTWKTYASTSVEGIEQAHATKK